MKGRAPHARGARRRESSFGPVRNSDEYRSRNVPSFRIVQRSGSPTIYRARMLFAYIDPVSGSILLQLIIAGITGVGVFFRRSLKRLFCFKPRAKSDLEKARVSRDSTNDGV